MPRRLRAFPLCAWLAPVIGLALSVTLARAAEVIPPLPAHYFNDYAGVVSAQTVTALDAELTQFERTTSNQLLVVVYPHMQSDSSVEDYTVRTAQQWHAGQKGRDNGAVLFVFTQDRQVYIQVGYGLEPTLTDATCHQIIENEIKPRFRAGDYDGGLRAAVTAIMQATRGEYKGTGRTAGEASERSSRPLFGVIIFMIVLVISGLTSRRRARLYGSSGSRWLWPALWLASSSGRGGGGWSGGGGGGGGFSGGGGSFGGGGAGGSW